MNKKRKALWGYPPGLMFLLACLWLRLAMGQPALPKMDRQFVWLQPNTNGVTGYELRWGTNRLTLGLTNSATIKLEEGVNTVVLRASGVGPPSDPVTNLVRLIKYDFQESTNAGASWLVRTSFTYAVDNYRASAWFRARLDWVQP